VASSWILFFTYQDDARSNTHQICIICSVVISEVDAIMCVVLNRAEKHEPYGYLVGTTKYNATI